MANSLYKFYVKASNYIVKSPACKAVLNLVYPAIKPVIAKANTFSVSTSDFLFLQHKDGVFIRPDMIIRYMFLEQHYGKSNFDLDAIELYEKMQDYRCHKVTGKDMTAKFYRLIDSYEKNGYNSSSAVEIDKNLLIRDGSHRTALAIYLDIPEFTVHRTNKNLPVDYKLDLFEKTNFTDKEKKCIYDKLSELLDKFNRPLNIILFNASATQTEDICQDLKAFGKIIDCQKYIHNSKDYKKLLQNTGKIKNNSSFGKNTNSTEKNTVSVIRLKLDNITYTPIENPKHPVISDTKNIEKLLRSKYFSAKLNSNASACVPSNFMENHKLSLLLPTQETDTVSV